MKKKKKLTLSLLGVIVLLTGFVVYQNTIPKWSDA